MNTLLAQMRLLILRPAENPVAAALGIGIIAIAFLLVVILLLVWAVPSRSEPDSTPVKKVRGPRSVRSLVLVAVLVLLALCSGYVTTSQNSYCAGTCHAMTASDESWQSSPHRSVPCVRCHEGRPVLSAPAAALSRMRSVYLQFSKSSAGAAALVPDARCIECHSAILRGTVTSRRGIAMRHSDVLAAGAACADCHGIQGHQASPKVQMSLCSGCHNGVRAAASCKSCHVRPEQRLIKSGDGGFGNVALPSGTNCAGCHDSRKCDKCHGISMPHPADFGDHHREAAAQREVCSRCHPDTYCARCHKDSAVSH